MRIKELAAVTGSTVRTIRYYHHIGLLPVPGRRDGARDYDMTHVARLVRVRWLTQAGVPLAAIAAMVEGQSSLGPGADADQESVLSDLRASLNSLDDQLVELGRQRERITSLISAAERDGRLSPMPAGIALFYEQMLTRADDDASQRLIRRERDFVELALYRGDMPDQSVLLYEGLTEAGMARSLESFRVIADRVAATTRRDIATR